MEGQTLVRKSLLLLVIVALAVIASQAYACVGARPLAMGGAFTGLADDVNTTYWNPAGLTQLTGQHATWMHTTTNRDEINYQDYFAYTSSIKNSKMSFGVSIIKDNVSLGAVTDNQTWIWASTGYKISDKISVGLNIRGIQDSPKGYSTDMALDLGGLYKINDKWTAGLLIQDFNEAKIHANGLSIAKHMQNWRPGASYRLDENTVFSAELYDLFDNGSARALRLGGERKLVNGWAVRAGLYGAGNSSCFTFGAGKSLERGSVDLAVMTGDLNNTLILSGGINF